MKNLFPGHFPLSEEELSNLMQDALFVLDTNVLLNMYRYTESSREHFFKIIGLLNNRIHIPYQVACEFFDARIKVIQDQNKAIDLMDKAIEDSHNRLKNELNQFRKHAHVDIAKILRNIGKSFNDAQAELKQIRENRSPVKASDDPILQRLAELLASNVIAESSEAELQKRKKSAEERIQSKIPPGFSDKNKSGEKPLGDVLIWFEIIKLSQEKKLPVVFVTDDIKDDWWLRVDGQMIGPLPALRQEFRKATTQHFHMYQAENFIKHAAELLRIPVDQGALSEAAKVSADQAKAVSEEKFDSLLDELFPTEESRAGSAMKNIWKAESDKDFRSNKDSESWKSAFAADPDRVMHRLAMRNLKFMPPRPLLQHYSRVNNQFIPIGEPQRMSIPGYTEELMRKLNKIIWVPELDGFYAIVEPST